MVAAVADGCGGDDDNNERPVVPLQGRHLMPVKVSKRKPKPRDRPTSEIPNSIATTAVAPLRDGADREPAAASHGGNDGAEQPQQQAEVKKPRLVWTTELHGKFVRACKSLGTEKAVPKAILRCMNVDGLTRENIASHLQKYRGKTQGRGQPTRRRGRRGAKITMRYKPPSLQPARPQPQPTEPAFLQAPSPSPSANPALRPQGPLAPANMSRPQIGRGPGQMVQGLPISVHQPREDFPVTLPPMQRVLYPPPQHQAAIEQRRVMMEQQAQRAAAARMMRRAAVAPGHINHHPVAMNYELGAQTLARAPAAVATAVQSHLLQPHMQASPDVNMSGGLYCPAPEASMRDEQTGTLMGMAQLRIAGEAQAGQVPSTAPAFAGSADSENGDQQDDSCSVLRFWNTVSATSIDHEFPPK